MPPPGSIASKGSSAYLPNPQGGLTSNSRLLDYGERTMCQQVLGCIGPCSVREGPFLSGGRASGRLMQLLKRHSGTIRRITLSLMGRVPSGIQRNPGIIHAIY